ncbi:MAG: AbrB family transcriptional regulator [Hyphomicrobiales bacterium]|nr:AbrB family transcriptional regulator [Hyphomicrobiales bacterium]
MAIGLARWGGLTIAAIAVSVGLEALRLPGAFLIGPLAVGVATRLAGAEMRTPKPAFLSAQAVVGAMLGAALTPSIVATFVADWPILMATVATIVAAATLSGWLLSRFGVTPGTTGVWGSSPGAASAMVIQAASHGADVPLVAFMQYLRVLFVASTASLVARLWVGVDAMPPPPAFFPPLDLPAFGLTIAIVAATAGLGVVSRVPSGAMLGPLLAGAILHGSDVFVFVLPTWLLILAYTGVGLTIGLGFTRAAVAHAARALPWIVLSILSLMGFAALVSRVLVAELGVDPLTAYLATSPGGMDTVAIIAAATPVDVAFVLALQLVRFFVLILLGPALSRAVARSLPQGGPARGVLSKPDADC